MSKAEEKFSFFSNLAEELGLEDEEKEGFIGSAMKRLGFKPVTNWADPEPDNKNDGGGDFFSSKRKEKESEGNGTRRVSGGGRAGGWQYDGR